MSVTVKSIGAVLAGFLVIILLSTFTDIALYKAGIFPSIEDGMFVTWMLAVALAYRCIYSILGGYVTAKLAPNSTMRHVKILGLVGTVISILGVIAGWNLSAHWYPIAIAVTAFPCVWIGGK